MSNYLVSVIGPTAIGKTSKSIQLAKAFSSEIISADSRQFYKEMCIGTAVPSPEELAAVPHHFIQHISINQAYSVGDYEKEAIQKIEKLFQEHQILFAVGGSGLYIDALTKGLDKFPKVSPEIRESLNKLMANEGIGVLQEQLKELDPKYAAKVDLENPHRIIRALEVCIASGKPYSSFLAQHNVTRNFTSLKIGLTAPRELIYERIEKRVDLMVENGLLEEARRLLPKQEVNALNTVGYKELFNYFRGEWTLAFAISEIKKNTRRFAKRQLTWFRKDPEIRWFSYDCPPQELEDFLRQKTSLR